LSRGRVDHALNSKHRQRRRKTKTTHHAKRAAKQTRKFVAKTARKAKPRKLKARAGVARKSPLQRKIVRTLPKLIPRGGTTERKRVTTRQRRARAGQKTHSRRISDRYFQVALRLLQEGKTLTVAAREIGVSPNRLEWQLRSTRAARKRKGRWLVRADLPRQMLLFSTQGAFIILPANRYQASKGAKFMSAVGRALGSNEPSEIMTFEGKSLADAHGRKWLFETDLDALYRLASTGKETFESVYRVVI
jgi:hypothetical protein